MKTNLLIFGTKNFNNSIEEIKEELGFSLIYFDYSKNVKNQVSLTSAVIVENQICADTKVLSYIENIYQKPILLLEKLNSVAKCKYDDKIYLPINFIELKCRILNLITSHKFNLNSSISIKNYILDKNEKKLKRDKIFITITEREVQLIELLFNENKPLSKKEILQKIWRYASNADTHTVETHIYRLRKKILDKFKDENFIINSKRGYSL